jgi:hypothetical protein
VPPDGLRDAVDVLEEFPGETGLADAREADDGQQARRLLLSRRMQRFLQQSQLAISADERGLQTGWAQCTARRGDNVARAPQALRLGLAFELVHSGVVVDDRGLGCPAGRVADVNSSRLGDGLDA